MATLADDVRDRAFERLYELHVRDVYRYVLAVLRNPADAEDVTQTTFLNAYRAFKAGERPRKPQNWLITIAHNACRTRAIRASRRPREVPLDDVVGQLALTDQEKPNVRELLHALGRLPFNQRAAITMRELEGRPYEEIAETLGVTVPAVEALLVRARRTMRLQGATLRGLAAVGLPRSLRGVFESGDAGTAGGALIGGGVLAKAAAVVVAGVVAGGVGYKSVEAGTVDRQHSAARLEPRAHVTPDHREMVVSWAPRGLPMPVLASHPAVTAAAARPAVARGSTMAFDSPDEEPAAPAGEAAAPGAASEAAPTSAPAAGTRPSFVSEAPEAAAALPASAEAPAAPAVPAAPPLAAAPAVPAAPPVPVAPPLPAAPPVPGAPPVPTTQVQGPDLPLPDVPQAPTVPQLPAP